jgi:hypothetical protein
MQSPRLFAVIVVAQLLAAAPAAAQLYSNGPLVNVPGGGAGNMDASRLQSSLGMTALGFGMDFTASTLQAIADDFTVPAPGWNVTRITVYGYQTDSGFNSTLTDLRLLIMNGPPSSSGSAVVFGNPVTNVLASTSFTNIFRDSQNIPGSSRRPIMSASANVNVYLPPGQYWLVWALAGQLPDGPWAPPITIPGVSATGNGLYLESTGWAPARDRGTFTQQGFPFVIDGSLPGGGSGPALTVATNATTFRVGDRMVVSAQLTAGSSLVDAYVVFDLPGGAVLSLTPGGIVSGMVPYARSFRPFNYGGVLLDMPIPSAPPGTYGVRAFLAIPNTTSPVSAVSQVLFTIAP